MAERHRHLVPGVAEETPPHRGLFLRGGTGAAVVDPDRARGRPPACCQRHAPQRAEAEPSAKLSAQDRGAAACLPPRHGHTSDPGRASSGDDYHTLEWAANACTPADRSGRIDLHLRLFESHPCRDGFLLIPGSLCRQAKCRLIIDSTGNLVNREEYTPYGETSFGSFARKRYR